MTIITCLTLRQPWAWAILVAGKDVENRTWTTNYRGRFFIHAAQTYDKQGESYIQNHLGIAVPSSLPRGRIVGSVELIDIVQNSESQWAMPEQFHWVLANPFPLTDQKPIKGRLGLWTVKI